MVKDQSTNTNNNDGSGKIKSEAPKTRVFPIGGNKNEVGSEVINRLVLYNQSESIIYRVQTFFSYLALFFKVQRKIVLIFPFILPKYELLSRG